MIEDAGLAELARDVGLGEVLEWASIRDEVDAAALVEGFLVCAAEVNAAMCRWSQMLAEIVARRVWVNQGARTRRSGCRTRCRWRPPRP